jgi:hypothetical protein
MSTAEVRPGLPGFNFKSASKAQQFSAEAPGFRTSSNNTFSPLHLTLNLKRYSAMPLPVYVAHRTAVFLTCGDNGRGEFILLYMLAYAFTV